MSERITEIIQNMGCDCGPEYICIKHVLLRELKAAQTAIPEGATMKPIEAGIAAFMASPMIPKVVAKNVGTAAVEALSDEDCDEFQRDMGHEWANCEDDAAFGVLFRAELIKRLTT